MYTDAGLWSGHKLAIYCKHMHTYAQSLIEIIIKDIQVSLAYFWFCEGETNLINESVIIGGELVKILQNFT